jgi:Zn-dependent hydrolases, including glyoxylases
MFLKRLATGMLGSNCYIIGDEGSCAVIDPGVSIEEIMRVIGDEKMTLKYIILTHAHIDHMISVDELRDRSGGKLLIHEQEKRALGSTFYNGSSLFGLNKVFKPADELLKDGDVLKVGGLKLEIIHTPGHTSGGISIKVDNIVFTGDTLFRMSIGRTDLGDGVNDHLANSLKNKLMKLDDDVIVYPGHGTTSTIGYERENNPFL